MARTRLIWTLAILTVGVAAAGAAVPLSTCQALMLVRLAFGGRLILTVGFLDSAGGVPAAGVVKVTSVPVLVPDALVMTARAWYVVPGFNPVRLRTTCWVPVAALIGLVDRDP